MGDSLMKQAMHVAAALKAKGYVLYGQRVAVVQDPAPETVGRIIVPDAAKIKPITGTVVMIGEGLKALHASQLDLEDQANLPLGLNLLDRVTYTKYNPLAFDLTLPNGKIARVLSLHATDVYFGWRDDNA